MALLQVMGSRLVDAGTDVTRLLFHLALKDHRRLEAYSVRFKTFAAYANTLRSISSRRSFCLFCECFQGVSLDTYDCASIL